MKFRWSLTVSLSILSYSSVYSQEKTDTVKVPKQDLWDIVFPKKLAPGEKEVTSKIQKSILPYISANPATGIEFGVFGNLAAYFGERPTTRLSNLTVGATYTTKDQFFTSLRSNIFTNHDKWILSSDNRFYKYSQSTYGLGSSSSKNDEVPLQFNMIRFYETALREIYKSVYAGVGINYQRHYAVTGFKPFNNNQKEGDVYSVYSANYGFDPTVYTSAGFNIAAGIDSRDNIINAYKGVYARVNYALFGKFFGGASKWQNLFTEFRTYLPMKKNNSQVLAFWYYGSFITSGNAPYMDLPAIGWDTYGNSGRGYVQGRFRGNSLMYGEAEYRLRLTKSGLLGAVAFLNCSTTSNKQDAEKLFDAVNPAGGIGLRIKLNKISRTNITIDYGIGKNSNGFYLNVGETF
ncbi:BamA/TamA family outer membrane protein [Solitalea canadensis]|uniref:Outer membrane protein/protective antigen OMA87 n=1 Tax=Solitalea canadensis (strain ATCC 29591 / DSM 3403 / JCM 21819 / LMG 8368 / NBRC 15130 / NCIMB 12057 / USAM 9D) TaxID=929556 RepID=H8KY24_SOLCM|nr:BamA/TamA family outer membrane protein [Solitalea canadensis]AFD05762.1 outer membrane protein/protective antigen OMA87 [Solitalea canadensis DSM 3403]